MSVLRVLDESLERSRAADHCGGCRCSQKEIRCKVSVEVEQWQKPVDRTGSHRNNWIFRQSSQSNTKVVEARTVLEKERSYCFRGLSTHAVDPVRMRIAAVVISAASLYLPNLCVRVGVIVCIVRNNFEKPFRKLSIGQLIDARCNGTAAGFRGQRMKAVDHTKENVRWDRLNRLFIELLVLAAEIWITTANPIQDCC